MRIRLALVSALVVALAACGGGGGDSGGGNGGGNSGGTPPPSGGASDYPVLAQTADFNLPAIAEPVARTLIADVQRGQVLLAGSTAAPAGLRVELLDASNPSAPAVLATGQTDASGAFSVTDAQASASASTRWLRVTLADGTLLRAYPTGWTQISPGTELAVSEMARLLRAGAFSAHVLTAGELGNAQQSLDLVWLGNLGMQAGALRDLVRFRAPWNLLLDNLNLAAPAVGAGDVAGLQPVPPPILDPSQGASWPSSITINGVTNAGVVNANCFNTSIANQHQCGTGSTAASDEGENFIINRAGVQLFSMPFIADLPRELIDQIGAIAVLEFPYVPGTQVVFSNPTLTLNANPLIHAAVKITRRTYPAAPLQAMGTTVQAIRVVLDYEVSTLDTTSKKQVDVLVRESRWFAPQAGRVRIEATRAVQSGGKVTTLSYTMAANSVSGMFFNSPQAPFAGTAEVKALALRHRDAVYSAALNRIYVATEAGGGQILEIDPDTLATLRSVQLTAVPSRLALSNDGSRLYAGQAGGLVSEFNVSDLSLVRSFTLPVDAYGQQYREVRDLSVDPFDASRILVLAGTGSAYGAVLTYRAGILLLRNAPSTNVMDYGWGAYYPTNVAWSTVRDEFLAASLLSPNSLYRFRAAGMYADLADLDRVGAVGWIDVGGEVVTSAGDVLDAQTLRTLRSLSLAPLRIQQCARFDTTSDLCSIVDWGDASPYMVRLNHGDSAFLGTYRPVSAQPVVNGCAGFGGNEGSLGFDAAVLAPMSQGRSLARTLPAEQGVYCSLQVWTMHGVAVP